MTSDFLAMTRAVYGNHKRRAKGYYCKLEYTLAELRGWFHSLLGSDGGGVCRCNYCRVPISAHTLIADHRIPLSRAGEFTLANLAPACEACNDQKGDLTDTEFWELLAFLDEHHPAMKESVLKRLQKAEKLAAVKRRIDRERQLALT